MQFIFLFSFTINFREGRCNTHYSIKVGPKTEYVLKLILGIFKSHIYIYTHIYISLRKLRNKKCKKFKNIFCNEYLLTLVYFLLFIYKCLNIYMYIKIISLLGQNQFYIFLFPFPMMNIFKLLYII